MNATINIEWLLKTISSTWTNAQEVNSIFEYGFLYSKCISSCYGTHLYKKLCPKDLDIKTGYYPRL